MRERVDFVLSFIWNFITFLLATHIFEALWHDKFILMFVGLIFFPGGICRGFMLWVDWLSAIF